MSVVQTEGIRESRKGHPVPSAVPQKEPRRTRPRGDWRGEDRASNAVLGQGRRLAQPTPWVSVLRELKDLSRRPVPTPSWWTSRTAFYGGLETLLEPVSYEWKPMEQARLPEPPAFLFLITMVGWGDVQLSGQSARRVLPGIAFCDTIPSRYRYYLPPDSPGWTFGWLAVHHPYVCQRIARQVKATGSFVDVARDARLADRTVRLLSGALTKDFGDRFDVELALMDFMFAYERAAQQMRDDGSEGERLLDEIRSRVMGSLPEAIGVTALAAGYGMSRVRFSRFFRERTGLTPGHFATQVRVHEAARMLVETSAPLKQIAGATGFANANHFSKVFRRLQHMTPMSYRRAIA